MSTSVSDHQRGKGPGNSGKPPSSKFSNNASKGGDYEEVESWRNQNQAQQHHQGYGQANDPYMNYGYGSFQYQAPFGVNENGPWSNGTDMGGFLGGGNYASQGMHDSQGGHYGGDAAMFSGGFGGGGGGPGFGYGGYGNGGDYSTWGGPQPRKHYDDYYGGSRDGGYGDERGVKMMEQGMGGLSLRDGGSDPDLKESMGGGGGGSKRTTWASIASQPAKPTTIMKKKPGMPPPPIIPGAWESKNGTVAKAPIAAPVQAPHPPPAWERPKIPPPQPGPPPPQPPPPQSAPPDMRGSRDRDRDRDSGHRDSGHRGGGGYQDPPPMGGRGGYMPKQSYGHGRPPPPSDQYPPHSYSQPPPQHSHPPPPPPQQQQQQRNETNNNSSSVAPPTIPPPVVTVEKLEKLKNHDYNPTTFDLSAEEARFFVIKSYSEDDIHRSIKYEIWCSTEHGNRRLNDAWKERDGKGPIFLFFSVNGSGHFCGMAQMKSHVDYNASASVWAQDKWKGQFKVKWVYVKDVPNAQLRNIRLENNENKPVTNSRDTQEVPFEKGKQVLKIIHTYPHTTSIFDDFTHYEKRQEEEDQRRTVVVHQPPPPPPHQMHDRNNDHGGPGGPGGYGGGGRGRGGFHGNHHGGLDGGHGGHFGGGRGGRDRDFGGGRGENHRDFRDHGDRMDRNHDHHRGGSGGMDRGGGNHFNGRGDGGHRDFYQRDRGDHPRGGMRGGGRGGHHPMRD